jgi:hypothetical protein
MQVLYLTQKLRFVDFKIGQTFEIHHIIIARSESDMYMSITRIRNILLENKELAEKEGIEDAFLSGRSIIARAEGEMTRLDAFTNNVIMLYGMDGDPSWNYRQTRFLNEVHPGEELSIKYIVSNKINTDDQDYGILSVDFEIRKTKDQKLAVISRRNLYRMKK